MPAGVESGKEFCKRMRPRHTNKNSSETEIVPKAQRPGISWVPPLLLLQSPDLYPALSLSFILCLPPLAVQDGPNLPAFRLPPGAGKTGTRRHPHPRPARACAEPLIARTRSHQLEYPGGPRDARSAVKPPPFPLWNAGRRLDLRDSSYSTRPLSHSSGSSPHGREPGLKTETSRKQTEEGPKGKEPRRAGSTASAAAPPPAARFLPPHWSARPSVSARGRAGGPPGSPAHYAALLAASPAVGRSGQCEPEPAPAPQSKAEGRAGLARS